MEQLFKAVQTAYDPKNKPVHLCDAGEGMFYVYKPSSGFKSRLFDSNIQKQELMVIFDRKRHCGQTFASYLPGEAEEVAPVEEIPAAPVVDNNNGGDE